MAKADATTVGGRDRAFTGGSRPGGRATSRGASSPANSARPPARVPRGDVPPAWRWLCLDHVRAFNSGYNFFAGMNTEQIEEQQKPYGGWERETRAFSHVGADRPPKWADFGDPLDAIGARFRQRMEEARAEQAPRADGSPLSREDRCVAQDTGARTRCGPACAARRAMPNWSAATIPTATAATAATNRRCRR